MVGIFIGIAAVVALVSLGQGLQKAINDQFESLGTDRIIISPGGAIAGPMSGGISSSKLTEHDLDIVKKVGGVKYAMGQLLQGDSVFFKDETKGITGLGMMIDSESVKLIETVDFLQLSDGRQLQPGDRYKAIAGYKLGQDFYKKPVHVGDTITIKGIEFDVIGVQKKSGTGLQDVMVRIPIDVARELYNEPDRLTTIMVKTQPGSVTSAVAENIEKKMRGDRGLDKGEEDFTVQTSEQLVNSFNSILNIVQAVLIGLAAISLVVGGIGITNTMYTAVLERTQEIGIMKAIGAQNSDILWIFMIESGLLGLMGGLIGVGFGIGISKIVESVAAAALGTALLTAYFPWYLIAGALLFSFFVGAISGVMPARHASRLRPVEALRYE